MDLRLLLNQTWPQNSDLFKLSLKHLEKQGCIHKSFINHSNIFENIFKWISILDSKLTASILSKPSTIKLKIFKKQQ